MRKWIWLFALLIVALAPSLAKETDENSAIIAATLSYVTANSGMTKISATVEKREGDFARVKVSPKDAAAADPAWVFLKKTNGKWNGLTLGTAFSPDDYQQFGIPKSLRVN